jgi:hypothetical protein
MKVVVSAVMTFTSTFMVAQAISALGETLTVQSQVRPRSSGPPSSVLHTVAQEPSNLLATQERQGA